MSRYVIAKVHDGVYLPTPQPVDLPPMQPGDSVRVTLRDDGGFDVAPLKSVPFGPSGRLLAMGPWWADAPEQENDR